MRVLIATVTAGAGHLQAAAALEEAWKTIRPNDTLQKLDVLNFTPRLYRKVYLEGYIKIVEHAPELWGHVFKKTDNPALVRKLGRSRRTLAKFTKGKFIRQLKNSNRTWCFARIICRWRSWGFCEAKRISNLSRSRSASSRILKRTRSGWNPV